MAATTARRKTPAKPAGRPAPRAVIGGEPFEPLRLGQAPAPVEERVVIAYLDDYELTMAAHVHPTTALKIARTSRTRGDEVAMAEMLEEALGTEGYLALSNYKKLTDDDLVALVKVIQKVTMGATEIPKASSGNG